MANKPTKERNVEEDWRDHNDGKPANGEYLKYLKPDNPREAELYAWWLDTASEDFFKTVPKMSEYGGAMYGSADLHVMGDTLATLLSERGAVLNIEELGEQVAQELAVWFYALGKISRLISDYRAGRPGKADTWFDLCIYAMMARRIQQNGVWP